MEIIKLNGVDFDVSNASRLVEIHRNVTVEVLEDINGNLSYGWISQPNSEHEYITEEDIDEAFSNMQGVR